MVFKIGARDDASTVFSRVAAAATALEKKLDDLGRKDAKPKITLDSDAAHTRVTQLSAALKEIKNQRARVDVDLGTATADVGNLRRELSYFRDVKVKVRVDAGRAAADMAELGAQLGSFRNATATVDLRVDDALTRVAQLRARLDELRDVRIGVEVVAGTARVELAAIARAARRLSGVDGQTIRLKIEVDAGNSVAELTAIATLLREVRGTTRARVQVDTANGVTAVARLASGLGSLFKVAGGGLAIPGLISTVGQVASLGASVMSLTGVLGLLPAAGAVGAGAIAAVTVGLQGFGEALSVRDDAEAFAEALTKLSPAARAAAVAVRDLGPAWTGVRLDVQERLFAGLGDTINRVSSAYLPSMRTGLSQIATELNTGAQGFAAWATEGRTVADVDTILANTASTMRELAPAGTNVAAALTDVAVVGSTLMPELASGATNATARFREFVAEARRTGELEQWIRGGITTLEQLGRIAGNTGGILGSVFSASEEAGYGFLDAVEQVTGEIDTLLSSVEGRTALVDVFRESGEAVNAALPGVRDLGTAALETTGAFARSDGLERFATLVSNAASAAAPLVSTLGDLAGDTLGNLAGAADIAVTALTPIAALGAGIVSSLGPIPGVVIAAAVAYKTLGLATASMVALSTSTQVAAVSAAAFAGRVTGSAAAAGAAGRATLGLGTAMGALGRALPLVGIGLVAVAAQSNLVAQSQSRAAAALLAGGQAQRDYEQSTDSLGERLLQNTLAFVTFGAAADAVTLDESAQEARDLYDAMSPLQKAQTDATRATNDYNLAVKETGPTSGRALAAAAALATAHENLGRAEQQAADIGRSHTQQIQAQNDAMRSQISTAFAYEDAVRATGEAHQAAADALASSGADSEEYRTRVTDLARAIDDQAAAAAAQAAALGGAEAGAAAYATEILRATDVSTGPGRDAFVRLAQTMDTAGLAALTSAAEVSGLATEIITLPDGRTVTVVAAADRAQLDSITDDLNALAATEFVGTVTINGDATPFRDGLLQSVTLANGTAAAITLNANDEPIRATIGANKYLIDTTTGVMTIEGNAAPGEEDLSGFKYVVDSETGVVTIEANTGPAIAGTQAALTFADGSTATITIDGDPTLANGQTTYAVRFADGSTGTVTVEGNPDPATGRISGVVRYGNGQTATVTVAARDLATGVINRIPKSSTHTVYIRTENSFVVPGKGRLTAHDGALVAAKATRFHDGGVASAYADGGMRPFRAGIAQKFPPGLLRITGDRVDVDEFYLPDNAAPRSLALGAEWARRRGMDLVPKNAAAPAPVRSSVPMATATVTRQMVGSATSQPLGVQAVSGQVDLSGVVAALNSVARHLSGRPGQDGSLEVVRAIRSQTDQLMGSRGAGAWTGALSAADHRLLGTDGAW